MRERLLPEWCGAAMALFLLALCGCSWVMWEIPTSSTVRSVLVCGTTDTSRVELREVGQNSIVTLSPEGIFYPTTSDRREYWISDADSMERLRFLNDGYNRCLTEVTSIPGTNIWVAFKLQEKRHDDVDIVVYVFDKTKLLHTTLVSHVDRYADPCRDDYSTLRYGIRFSSDMKTVRFPTRLGWVSYDVLEDKLAANGR